MKVVIFIVFVGIYLVLTSFFSIREKEGDILDYIGIGLGLSHLIYGTMLLRKLKGMILKMKCYNINTITTFSPIALN